MLGYFLGVLLVWFPWEFFASVPVIVLPLIAAVAAVLAVPLRGLVPAAHARQSRRYPDKTGPELTWRSIAQACIAAAIFLVEGSNLCLARRPAR
jgi:hypothetical protein